MNRSITAEIEKLKQQIPSKGRSRSDALFTINRIDSGFEVEVIISNSFGHMPEAIKGDENYLVSDDCYEFGTISEAIAFIDSQRNKSVNKPMLALLGSFTKAELAEIQKTKNILLLNTKYLSFLYGIVMKEEYETKVID